MLGTLKFMAPERLDGIEGPQGDVYSLGLVTARMVLGRALPMPPRRAESHLTMLKELRDELAVRLATDHPALAADMTRLVLRMLDYDPAGRPTAAAIAERCRVLLSQADGPWLREWAPDALPPILHEGEQTTDDPHVGTTLTEMTDTVSRLLPKEHIPIVRLDVFSSQNVILPDEDEDVGDPLSAGTPQSERALGALMATITLVSLATIAATAWSLLAPATAANVSYAAPTTAPIIANEAPALPAPTVAEGTAKPRIVRKKK
jgi:serine/threonine protein kinase